MTRGILLLFLLVQAAGAMGVALGPMEIMVDGAHAGQGYERAVTVFNLDDGQAKITLRTEGDAASWLFLTLLDTRGVEVSELDMAPHSSVPLLVRIAVPPDAAAGTHTATVIARTEGGAVPGPEPAMRAFAEMESIITVKVAADTPSEGEPVVRMVSPSPGGAPAARPRPPATAPLCPHAVAVSLGILILAAGFRRREG